MSIVRVPSSLSENIDTQLDIEAVIVDRLYAVSLDGFPAVRNTLNSISELYRFTNDGRAVWARCELAFFKVAGQQTSPAFEGTTKIRGVVEAQIFSYLIVVIAFDPVQIDGFMRAHHVQLCLKTAAVFL